MGSTRSRGRARPDGARLCRRGREREQDREDDAGGQARVAADAPHRLIAWGSFGIVRGWVLSPTLEWHSGFAYTVLDAQRHLLGAAQTGSFPAYFTVNVDVQKSVHVFGRHFLVGLEFFNLTDHANPRDVYAVAGSPRFGTFTNSVGPTVRGVYTLTW